MNMKDQTTVKLTHNLKGEAFMWLWAKYVRAVNDQKHCTASLRGPYSTRLSRHNPDLATTPTLHLDEIPQSEFKTIYICGVARNGYVAKKNYPFNLHTVIQPQPGAKDSFAFDGWELCVENGTFLPIPGEAELPERYRNLPPEYTTCRIFGWAVCAPARAVGIHFVHQ